MKVILLQELKGKGGEGDVVEVADGFANNYLFREGIAIRATKGNLKQLEQRRHNIAKREESRIANANKTKETLDNATITIIAQVGEEGQLFGSITSPMIAEAVKKDTGIEVDRRRVELKRAIKAVGQYEVPISLYRNIKTNVKLVVAGSEEELAETAEKAEKAEKIEAAKKAETAEKAENADEAAASETSDEAPAEEPAKVAEASAQAAEATTEEGAE